MSSFPGSPQLLKGGLVAIDPTTGQTLRVITLQYNPETLSRSLQIQGVGDGGARSEVLRLKGPPIETFKLDAEIDAADQLEFPDKNRATVEAGIYPQLAALEILVYPTSDQLQSDMALARSGALEIAPLETPLLLFVWSKSRVVPVRLTEFSIIEEMFDPQLNPIRAKVSLGLRVLSVNDFESIHRGTSLYMSYHQQKERLASRVITGQASSLGVQIIP